MNEMEKVSVYETKLEGICEKNSLVYRFDYNRYPITLTIRPAGGMDNQISMLESAQADEGQYTSPDATIIFAFKDGELTYRTSKTFTISDALFGKVKNLFRKMHALYCQYVHRFCTENRTQLPEIVTPEEGGETAMKDDWDEFMPGEDDEVGEENITDESEPDDDAELSDMEEE